MKKTLRVLIVEDSKIDAEIVLRQIEIAGYHVEAERVETSEAMRTALAGRKWDVVVADYTLPRFGAPEALALLQESGVDLPFIIVSGTIGEETAVEMMRRGAQDFLLKGKIARLGPAIERELREAESRRARREAEAELERNREKIDFLYQEARRAIAARDEFLSIASHELKTPVTALMLELQGARRGARLGRMSPSPEAFLAKAIDQALIQAERLAHLVEEVLDVTELQSGRVVLRFEETDLSELVRGVCERFSERLSGAGCELRTEIAPGVLGRWDVKRIDRVLSNLLTNALEYAPGGPVIVTLTAQAQMARLSVRDHGPGIPENLKARLFRRFERGVGPTNITGFGLGLYLVEQIARAHAGKVRVESEPGNGSTFTVELPLRTEI